MTSQEVLAPPPSPRHPVRRAVASVLVLGVVGAAVVLKMTSAADGPTPPAPAAGGSASMSAGGPDPVVDAPARADVLHVYPATPLDGHWVSRPLSPAESRAIVGTRPRQRLTLQIRGTALVLWVGTWADPNRRIIGYEAIYVQGHGVRLSPVGSSQDTALYRWRIRDHDQRLAFDLVRRTDAASPSARLVTVSFVRRPDRP